MMLLVIVFMFAVVAYSIHYGIEEGIKLGDAMEPLEEEKDVL